MKKLSAAVVLFAALAFNAPAQQARPVGVDYQIFTADGGSELYLWLNTDRASVNGYIVVMSYSAGFQAETVTRVVKKSTRYDATDVKFFIPAPPKSVKVRMIQVSPVTLYDGESTLIEPQSLPDAKPAQ